jgi:hypothetical protein
MAQAPPHQTSHRSSSRNPSRPTNKSSSNSTPDPHHISPQLSAALSISQPDAEFEAMQQELLALTVRRREIRQRIAFLEGIRPKSPDSSHHEHDADGSRPAENPGAATETLPDPYTPPVNTALVRMRDFLQHMKAEHPQFIQDLKDSQQRNKPLKGLSARKYKGFIEQLAFYCQEMVEERLDQFRAENSGADDEFIEALRRKFYEILLAGGE